MNRTIKDATVKRYHGDDHAPLSAHLETFIHADNFARRSKTLGGLTTYELICQSSTIQPERFSKDPIQQMTGLKN